MTEIVRQHEALKCLVAELIIADGRNDKRCRVGGRVVPDVDDRVRGVSEARCSLRRSGFRVYFPPEKVVGAISGDSFEKVGERCEARVAFPLLVEGSCPQEFELWAMVGVAVDLAVVELDGADGLGGRKARKALRPQTAVAAVTLVFLQPRGDRRWRDVPISLLLETRRGLFKREAEIVVGKGGEDHSQRVRPIAKRCGPGRENALT